MLRANESKADAGPDAQQQAQTGYSFGKAALIDNYAMARLSAQGAFDPLREELRITVSNVNPEAVDILEFSAAIYTSYVRQTCSD